MNHALELDRMGHRHGSLRLDNELVLAGAAILGITAIYLAVSALTQVPAASGLIGHSFGILGFSLMLLTETLYSVRKRARRARWGPMSAWLKFHIFTGLVGPYLVFLHAAWKFQGLAGIVLLMTGVVVASGFFGRYIYTAVPRTADGAVLERSDIERRLSAAEAALARREDRAQAGRRRPEPGPLAGMVMVLGRFVYEGLGLLRDWAENRSRDPHTRAVRREIQALIRRRDELERQLATLAAARRLMSAWHTLHVPLGLMMFSAAGFHILAAMYYATLLK